MDIHEKLAELLGKAWEVWNDYIRKWCDNAEKTGDWNAPMTSHDDICADFLITNGVTIQEWIPVSERLPDEGMAVLTLHDKYVQEYGNMVTAVRKNGNWYGCLGSTITHWMPLPELPKE